MRNSAGTNKCYKTLQLVKYFFKSYSDVSFEKNEKHMRIDGNPNKQSLLTPILSFCIFNNPSSPISNNCL